MVISHNISFSISFKNKTAPAITQMQKRLAFVPTLMFYTSRRLLKFLAIFHGCFLGVKPRQWNANLCYVVCLCEQTINKGLCPLISKYSIRGHNALVHIAQSLRFHSTQSDSEASWKRHSSLLHSRSTPAQFSGDLAPSLRQFT